MAPLVLFLNRKLLLLHLVFYKYCAWLGIAAAATMVTQCNLMEFKSVWIIVADILVTVLVFLNCTSKLSLPRLLLIFFTVKFYQLDIIYQCWDRVPWFWFDGPNQSQHNYPKSRLKNIKSEQKIVINICLEINFKL